MHDLVVGGSGMLAGLCVELAQAGRRVSVIARGKQPLAAIAARTPGILPIAADYTDAVGLEQALRQAIGANGPIERAVCWIHDSAPAAPLAIARHVQRLYCHVMGSAVANPAAPDEVTRWQRDFASLPHLEYRIAVLGFVRHSARGRSRWLTDEEISSGVARALAEGGPVSIVGVVEPWSQRP